jgi:hypothetical protein
MSDGKHHPLIDPKTGGFRLPPRAFVEPETGEVVESTVLARWLSHLATSLVGGAGMSVWLLHFMRRSDVVYHMAGYVVFFSSCVVGVFLEDVLHNAVRG